MRRCESAAQSAGPGGEEEADPIQSVAILLSRDKASPLWRSTPSSSPNQVHYGFASFRRALPERALRMII